MKRRLEGGMAEDDCSPPAKRMSMLHNTPKQWKETRRRLLSISRHKLKCIVDVETNLRKSVLLNNTYRKIKHQLKYSSHTATERCTDTVTHTDIVTDIATDTHTDSHRDTHPDSYTPRGVFASSRRRLMMSPPDWDTMETAEDDIQSKTLTPPPTDLSLVLSDILGEDMDKSCDTPSCDTPCDTPSCDTPCDQQSDRQADVPMDTSIQSTEKDTSTTGNQSEGTTTSKLCNEETDNQYEDTTGSGNQTSSAEDQTEALNLSVGGCKSKGETSPTCDNNDICDKSGSDIREKALAVTIDENNELKDITSDPSPCDLSRSEKSDHKLVECEPTPCESVERFEPRDPRVSTPTNALEDFVISPRVSEWKQTYQSPHTHLTFVPMFDLPVLSCPSLQTSNLIPKLLHSSVTSPQGHTETHIQTLECCDSDSMDSDLSSTHSDTEDTGLCDPQTTDGPAYDTDPTQHLWACFQQFNMAIACS